MTRKRPIGLGETFNLLGHLAEKSLRENSFHPYSSDQQREGNGNPLQYSCLENLMDGGAWWATVHGVAESDTTERLQFSLRLVITFLSRSKRLLISWLQSPSVVILKVKVKSLSRVRLFETPWTVALQAWICTPALSG